MASTLEEKIEKLTKTIGELADKMTDLGSGGALQSSNDEVRTAAEQNTLRRLKMEEALLEKKEKQTEKEWRKFKEQQMYEETWIGKQEEKLNNFKERFGGIAKGASELYNTAMGWARKAWSIFNEAVGNLDKAAVGAYRTMGMSVETMKNLRQHAVATANAFQTARNFNADSADLLNLQVSYAKELGRNVNLASLELANLAAMKRLVGDEQAIKFTANFEKLGFDVNSASKEMVELFNDGAKTGLNFSKYAAAVADNLHLAQQYTFANGVDGLKNMVKQSLAVRWNMQQTAAFAEKVSNVEGAVTTSAQMSVLGGEFAKFANPMNMLYESLNDMESLNERLMKTFSQFATFNKQTNQIEVSAFDRMRIKAAAQAMGLDYGQVMDSVYGMGRAKVAEDQLRGSGLSDEYKTFLKNKAMIDRKDGRAYVNLMQKDGTYKPKYLDEGFSDEDKKSMDVEMRTESQDIKSIAKSALTIEEIIEGVKKGFYDKIAKWIEDKGGIEWVKEKINKLVDIGIKVVHFVADKILPNIKTIGYTMLGILAAIKIIPPLIKGIQMARISNAVKHMAYPYAGGAAMGSPMMMGPGMMMGHNGAMWQHGPSVAGHHYGANAWVNTATGGVAYNNWTRGEHWNSMSREAQMRYGRMYGRGAQIKNSLKYSPKARMGTSMGLGIAGAGLSIGGAALQANGHDGWGAVASTGGYALSGASMGMMFGPWGAAIGGAIGLIGGGLYEWFNYTKKKDQEESARREQKQREKHAYTLSNNGIMLRGEYDSVELEDMLKGQHNMSPTTRQKMISQGDGDAISLLYGSGGIITGESHAHGGVNINAEGGEAVIPKNATFKYIDVIKSLINGTFYKKYAPIVAEKPMGDIMKVSESNNSSQIGVKRIDFSTLNINMDGTLKLELAGNYKDIDARKLLDDPKFSRTLEGMIRENVAVLGNRDKRHALSRYDNPDPNGRNVKWR